jgi:hypothetical protein
VSEVALFTETTFALLTVLAWERRVARQWAFQRHAISTVDVTRVSSSRWSVGSGCNVSIRHGFEPIERCERVGGQSLGTSIHQNLATFQAPAPVPRTPLWANAARTAPCFASALRLPGGALYVQRIGPPPAVLVRLWVGAPASDSVIISLHRLDHVRVSLKCMVRAHMQTRPPTAHSLTHPPARSLDQGATLFSRLSRTIMSKPVVISSTFDAG